MDNDELFNDYEQDLEQLTTTIQTNLNTQLPTLRGDARRMMLARTGREVEEAEEIVSQMEIEVQTSDPQDKPKLQARLRQHKATLQKHKAELTSLAATVDRDDLLSSSIPPGDDPLHQSINMGDRATSPAQLQRTKLMRDTDQLNEGQRRLEESHRMALETEDTGAGILRDLRGQRDQLEHTRDNLYEADGSIGRASNTLQGMVRRAYQQKAITYAIIVLLVFLILYVLFSKLFG